jgi:hypothetical protein
MRSAEYGHVLSTAQPSMQRGVLPAGAFSSRNHDRSPIAWMLRLGLPIIQRRMSRSWDDLARMIGVVAWLSCQFPRT